MDEFINKLIERLEEKKSEHLHDEEVTQGLGKINLASFCSAKARAIDGAIEIVNQLAEEYNNDEVKGGWIEKLLKAKKNCSEDSDCSQCPFGQIEDRCILAELQIDDDIKKNNGWIPCSERLPKEGQRVWLSFTNEVTSYVKDAWWQGKFFVWNNCHIVKDTPIAWKPYDIPEPYQPKGE